MMLNWTPETEKPEAEKPVLLRLSDGDIIRAMWVPKFTREDYGNFEGPADYSEEVDCYYWPEGWYEWNRLEECHWLVDDAAPIEWVALSAIADSTKEQAK